MPTKDQAFSALRTTGDCRAAALGLGVPPGQAYLIATGVPADSGDAGVPEDVAPTSGGSTQFLVYDRAQPENPTTKPHVHEWITRRVEPDHPMREAAARRDAAPQETAQPDETDICSVLTRDHDRVTALLKQMKTIPGAGAGGSAAQLARRKSIMDMVTAALSAHEAAEQQYFWPAVRSLLPGGDRIADDALAQEREGADLLQRLGQLDPDDARFDGVVVELENAARKHVAYEDVVLLALGRDMAREDRRTLGAMLRSGAGRGTTRPQARAPKAPAAVTTPGAAASSGSSGSEPASGAEVTVGSGRHASGGSPREPREP